MDEQTLAMNRRRFIAGLTAAGVGSTLMPGALAAVAQDTDEVTVEMLEAAQRIAGLRFTPDELQAILARLNRSGGNTSDYEALRAANLGNSTQPALVFNPVPPGMTLLAVRRPKRAGGRMASARPDLSQRSSICRPSACGCGSSNRYTRRSETSICLLAVTSR